MQFKNNFELGTVHDQLLLFLLASRVLISVFGIRDILDPYLWLTDPDPTPDSTPFFSDFTDAKKIQIFG